MIDNSSTVTTAINKHVILIQKRSPDCITTRITVATIEFAGIKFKTKASTSKIYIKAIQDTLLLPILQMFPYLKSLIVCE